MKPIALLFAITLAAGLYATRPTSADVLGCVRATGMSAERCLFEVSK